MCFADRRDPEGIGEGAKRGPSLVNGPGVGPSHVAAARCSPSLSVMARKEAWPSVMVSVKDRYRVVGSAMLEYDDQSAVAESPRIRFAGNPTIVDQALLVLSSELFAPI